MVSARGLLRCFLKNIVAVTFRHHREELSHILVQWFALSHSRSDPELRAHLSTEHVNVSISAAGWSPHHPDVLGLWHISAPPISKWPVPSASGPASSLVWPSRILPILHYLIPGRMHKSKQFDVTQNALPMKTMKCHDGMLLRMPQWVRCSPDKSQCFSSCSCATGQTWWAWKGQDGWRWVPRR